MLLNKKIFEILVPIRTSVENKKILKSLIKNKNQIKKVYFIVEIDEFHRISEEIKKSNLAKYIKYFILIEKNSTFKITKIKLASKFVDDDSFIVVLDEDDYLNDLKEYEKINLKDVDLILTNLNWDKNSKKHFLTFDPTVNHWYNETTFPYFNNHNTIPNGYIFKEVFNDFFSSTFQKHEDVYRSIRYLEIAKNYIYLKDKSFSIITYVMNEGENQESPNFSDPQAPYSINEILKNFESINFSLADDEVLSKSQINALIRIFRSALPLYEINKIEKKPFFDMRNKLISLSIPVDFENLYNTKKLKLFYDSVKHEQKNIKWYK